MCFKLSIFTLLILFSLHFYCYSQQATCDKKLPKSRDGSFSPDGKKIIFASTREGNSDIYIMNSNGKKIKPLISTPKEDHYPFFSPDGTKIIFDSYEKGYKIAVIYIADVNGKNLKRLTEEGKFNADPNFSPDGKKIVFYSKRDGHDQIYIMNADGREQKRITFSDFNENTPVWSPDGSKILFISYRDGNAEIYNMNPDGSEQKRVTNNPGIDLVARWSPDGQKIVYYSKNKPKSIDPKEKAEITIINKDGTDRKMITQDHYHDQGPVFSPNGKKILFTSCRGNQEIYIMNADGTGIKRLTFSMDIKSE